jgi:hypothetical protein
MEMEISSSEALDLFRKWFHDETPITALLIRDDSEVVVTVMGRINGLSDDILISDGSKDPNDRHGSSIIFPAVYPQSFYYIEAKDLAVAPEERARLAERHGVANLMVRLSDGSRLSIFEHAKAETD